MGKKSKKNRIGVVYSTDPEYDYEYEKENTEETLPKNLQRLRVRKETQGRKGKVVSIITGYQGGQEDKKTLCKLLKSKCGTGGSVIDEGILIQGDQRDKIVAILKKEGYPDVKKSGG